MPRIAITGAGGYLGRNLCRHFFAHNYQIRALVRDPQRLPHAWPEAVRYSLDQTPARGALEQVDALIHCAHEFRVRNLEESLKINRDGSLRLFDAARSAGVKTLVFISSMAAFDGCQSIYGKTKLAVEREAGRLGVIIIRPGTIYGRESAAVFASLQKLATQLPLIPLIGGGSQRIFFVHIDDLCLLVENLLNRDPGLRLPQPFVAAGRQALTLKEVLEKIASVQGKHPRFFSVPAWSLLCPLKFMELLGCRLPFRSDSLISLLNSNPSPLISNAEAYGCKHREFCVDSGN